MSFLWPSCAFLCLLVAFLVAFLVLWALLCPSCGLLVAFLCLLVAFLVAFLVPFLCPSCAFLVALARGGSASQSCVFLLGSGRFQFISWRNHASESVRLCFCSVWVLSGNILAKPCVRVMLMLGLGAFR